MKETKGTKAVRECRKQMENYTYEQRLALCNQASEIINAAEKEKFKPLCLTCGHNRDMILHDDKKWYCHRTHRI
jgi:NADH pyrophosphatase NudC (nudix superfamily)